MASGPDDDRIIYVHRSVLKLGIHSTARKTTSETFYEAFPQDDGRVKLVLLDMNDQSTALTEIVDQEELAAGYELVPDYFKNRKAPKEKAVSKKVAQGKEHLRRQEFHSAEYEFDEAIKIDDRNLEAHAGKGEALIGQNDLEGAKVVLDKLADFDELYQKPNKHVFNSFGITLRQAGFLDRALKAYMRALKMDPKDENLLYNMSLALIAKGDAGQGLKILRKVLKLNPDHQEAVDLIKKIQAKMA